VATDCGGVVVGPPGPPVPVSPPRASVTVARPRTGVAVSYPAPAAPRVQPPGTSVRVVGVPVLAVPPGPDPECCEPDVPDLVILFENGLT
jgi:hypothetical protein